MEILTLLKANIRRKKGTFISIMVLTIIIVTCMTAIVSVRDNYGNALEEAFEYADCGDSTAFVRTDYLTEEIRAAVENSELVERVEYYDAIVTNGTTVGENADGNSYFLMELPEGIRLFNENLDGFEEDIPTLKEGEIYFPLGLKEKLKCNVGDTVRVELLADGYAEFVIKGFVQEPSQGAMMIGWKQIFISEEDFINLYEQYKPLETEKISLDFTMVRIYQSEDSDLSLAKFQRQLNLETKIIDVASGAITLEQSVRYSTLLPDVVTNIVLVFVVFLYVIVLIVMSHSISTEIEIDYVTLGVLKSQGFSKGKIRIIIMMQYLLAQVVGIILGNVIAVPIERKISAICQGITAVLPERGLSVGKSILYTSIILLTSVILILIKTRKVAKISPVRAILGGRETIFFDSRLNAPISKKALSPSLSLRQITSAKKRYIGTAFIVAILTFSMITVNLTGNLLTSRSALAAMGLSIADIQVYYNNRENFDHWDEVEDIITSHSAIQEKNVIITGYASVNGENLYCEIYKYPEYISGVFKGREPLYDNEILITEMVADALDLKLGDEVTVTFQNGEDSFIISGFFQSGSDSGMAFAMNFTGAEKLGADTSYGYHCYVMEDKSKVEKVAEEIQEQYGEELVVEAFLEENNPVFNEYDMIVDALKVLIYGFSVLFAFVVVQMVCTKTFVQERTDIGIYKAMGFTSHKLRWGFAVRFFFIALLGSVLGVGLSVLFSGKMLGMALSLIGLSRVSTIFTTATVTVPMAAISISFAVFAYLASRKIKSVAVRELVVE